MGSGIVGGRQIELLDCQFDGTREVDLHVHSLASDGTLSPEEVVALAARRCVRYMALTDHDTTMGIPSARIAAHEWGIELIPGIEMTAEEDGEELHILGYFIDTENRDLQETLKRLRLLRSIRAQKMMEVLEKMGIAMDWADISRQTWESIGRPHVARILVSQGYAENPKDAFDRFLDPGRPAYVPLPRPRAEEVISLIRGAGGAASLAHPIIPGRDEPMQRLRQIRALLPALIRAGLSGLESYYPEYVPEVARKLAALARSLGLVPTGGSDFHTPPGHVAAPGGIEVPVSCLESLRQLCRGATTTRPVAART